ncbi:MAG: TetR/AcrR family transcriptional regulator [Ignavibacteria bacterium]
MFLYKVSEKEKILAYTSNRFINEGFYKISVDDLAAGMYIGKNTIYKYFPTKQDLLIASTKYFINGIKKNARAIFNNEGNAIEKLNGMLNLISSHVMRMSERFLSDMRIHNPDVWEVIDSMRKKLAYETISKLIQEGKKENIFIDYPNEILVTVFIGAFRAVMNPEFLFYSRFTIKEAFHYTHKILMNAILSDKGKVLLKKLKIPQ